MTVGAALSVVPSLPVPSVASGALEAPSTQALERSPEIAVEPTAVFLVA